MCVRAVSRAAFPKSEAAHVAQVALQLATTAPELVFRNPEKIEQGWRQMREDRAAFIEFFGSDELALPPAEAAERLDAYYRQRQQDALNAHPERRKRRRGRDTGLAPVEWPAELAEADTIGLVYDEIDGLNFYNDYGMLRELFADPALAGDKQYSDLLRGYLDSDSVAPLPIRRMAAAHPETADAVFRKVLRKPNFTWADHGEALLRRRKAWYYDNEPRPGISVIGSRLQELTALR